MRAPIIDTIMDTTPATIAATTAGPTKFARSILTEFRCSNAETPYTLPVRGSRLSDTGQANESVGAVMRLKRHVHPGRLASLTAPALDEQEAAGDSLGLSREARHQP